MPGIKRDFLTVINEQLAGGVHLTNLLFHPGGNVYILTYQKGNRKRHIFVDTGDARYGDEIFNILNENEIDETGIERIIITHRHPDHTGLAYLLANKSGAKIMAHSTFRSFVEGSQGNNPWSSGFDSAHLSECNFEYLNESTEPIKLNGVDFPNLSGAINIGESGRLIILGTPKTSMTHSPDQLIAVYSSQPEPHPHIQPIKDYKPTDDIIFSGDLWLMRGPMFGGGGDIMWNLRVGLHQIGNMMTGGSSIRRDPREQDAAAKDALKRGFCLIRVKPGHGDEFLGSRILPRSLMADNDILIEFGFPWGADKDILTSREYASKVNARREQAYASFVEELTHWMRLGYKSDEISRFLARIHREQSGGGPLVEEDRHERREQLVILLDRLMNDRSQAVELRQLAESTKSQLPNR
ncbi:MAG: hypothetical protein A2Z74_07305 [Chloroflexi bacterium RBG_13_46_9]|nr:MAG: hypothetical protein A2Z74_07305 [Chloroflexi bacterium RBG_13_46_9]